MAKLIQANLNADKLRFGLVAARFNEFITGKLVSGAIDALVRHGADAEKITQVWIPGAFEIPLAAQKLARSGDYDAILCVGCVIRGQTPHFDYVAGEAAKGVAQVALSTGVPISFGVITSDTLEQAIDRAGGKVGNKGADAAVAAIEMANLLRALGK
jgi:6,7-dimethyl-8-ribityllumazine synthase